MRRWLAIGLFWLAVAAASQPARGDGGADQLALIDEGYTLDSWPIALSARPILMPIQVMEARADVTVSVGDSPFEPTLLAPDLRYGFRRSMTAVFEHDEGLCLGGSAACPVRYGGLFGGIDVELADVPARFQLATALRLGVADVEPFTLAAKFGVPFRVMGPRLGVAGDFAVTIRLNQRDARRREVLDLPLTVIVQLADNAALFGRAAVVGPVDALDEIIAVPVRFGFQLSLGRRMDLGASFEFSNLAGIDGGVDGRTITAFFGMRR